MNEKQFKAFLKDLDDDLFCKHKGCKRGADYLKKWGYVKVNGVIYCMDHQPKVKS